MYNIQVKVRAICFAGTVYILWILAYNQSHIPYFKRIFKDLSTPKLSNNYNNSESLRIKYILLWQSSGFAPFHYLGKGQKKFIENNCSFINCFITTDKQFLDGNSSRFDAIGFNGRTLNTNLPQIRSKHQIFIYFNMESATNYPINRKIFDGFFNWTATYRLDSDIPIPYILIKNMNGDIVGPKQDMKWYDNNTVDEEKSFESAHNKSKAVAWFVSKCKTSNKRENYVNNLQQELSKYNMAIDIFGKCGKLKCPRHRTSKCNSMLRKDYYFYLSFENSFDKDYVTEKLLTALQNDVVPIVFGGADYSRFLAPDAYLDARLHDPQALAAIISETIKYPELYRRYFRWKKYYTYHDPKEKENVCAVCEALNNTTMTNTTRIYNEIGKWWKYGHLVK